MPAAAQITILSDGRLTKSIEADIKRAELRGFNPRFDVGSVNRGLGTIHKSANLFNESLKAAESRVLAFGAVAGQIFIVNRALQFLVKTAVNVEKSLTDINVILNASGKNLEDFSSSLFNIAKNTGQTFDIVAKAATEFARQGLGAEETLKRTRDALILTRLSGLEVVSSTEAITAAINSFNNTLLDSTTLINKFANVDAAFAVSSADLAEAIKRVGSTAQDTGVSLDSLIGLVTSAQQTTARGGAVIGNAFKTIFQRIQRPEVLQQISDFGIRVTDLKGDVLSADKLLINLAKSYDHLSSSQKNQTIQFAAGVFQANVFRAILGDLARGELSQYNKALQTSTSATNQAIDRNKELNKTLASLVNETLATLTQIGAKVGQTSLGPALKNIFNAINSAFSGKNEGVFGTIGQNIGEGLLKGIGNFISGPGLALLGAILLKLTGKFIIYTTDAIRSLLGINKEINLISSALATSVNYQSRFNTGVVQQLSTERQILATINEQNLARTKALSISGNILGSSKFTSTTNRNNFIAARPIPPYPNLGGALEGTLPPRPRYNPRTRLYENPETGLPMSGYDRGSRQIATRILGGMPLGFQQATPQNLQGYRNAAQLANSQNNEFYQQTLGVSANLFADKAREIQTRTKIREGNLIALKLAQEELQLTKDKLQELQNARSNRLNNKLLGAAIGFPILQGIAEQSIGNETLSRRRSSSLVSAGGGIASGAFAGGLIGSSFGPGGTIPGAIIGASATGISGLITVMKEWNNVIPDLEASINSIKDTTARTSSVADELVKLLQLLENTDPSISIIDRQKANNRVQQLLGQNPSFQGIPLTASGIRNRGEQLQGRFNTQRLPEELEKFIRENIQNGTAFKTTTSSKQIDNSVLGVPIMTAEVQTTIDQAFADGIRDFILSFTDQMGKNILSFLQDPKNDTAKNIFQSGDSSRILNSLPTIFRQAGIPGAQGLKGALKDTLNPEQLDAFFKSFAIGSSSNKSLGELTKQDEDRKRRNQEGDDVAAMLNKKILQLIKSTQDFSLSLEYSNKNIIAETESRSRIIEIQQRGDLDLERGRLSPMDINIRESRIEEGVIRRNTETRRKSNIAGFSQGISSIGLTTLEDLRDSTFKQGGTSRGKDFVKKFEQFQGNIRDLVDQAGKGNFNRDIGLAALTSGRGIFGGLKGDENKNLREELDKTFQILERALKEDGQITEDEIRALNENSAKIDQNTAAIEQNSPAGIINRFREGEFSRDEGVSLLSSKAALQTREKGFNQKTGFQNASDLARLELSYNQTQFFDDIQNGAVDAARTFRTEFAGAFKEFAKGAKSAGDAFRDFALNVAYDVQGKIIDIGINSLLGSALGFSGQKASVIVGALTGKSQGGRIGYSTGGIVSGGSGVKDDVPALLSPGEFVVKSAAVDKYGKEFFDILNNSASIKLNNSYNYDDPKNPRSGFQNFSPLLTSYAFEDDNNPQNRLRVSREEALMSYLSDFASYNSNKAEALKAFKKSKKSQLMGTFISSAISGIGAYAGASGKFGTSSKWDSPVKHARGGPIFGGNSPTDNVPAMLMGGEYVVNRSAVNRVGVGFLNNVNSGRYAAGGLVGVNSDADRNISDLLSRLIESNDILNKSIVNLGQNKVNNPNSTTQLGNNSTAPTIISNVTINMANDGSVKSDSNTISSGKTTEQDKENSKQMGEAIRNVVIATIIKEKNIGGLLRT